MTGVMIQVRASTNEQRFQNWHTTWQYYETDVKERARLYAVRQSIEMERQGDPWAARCGRDAKSCDELDCFHVENMRQGKSNQSHS